MLSSLLQYMPTFISYMSDLTSRLFAIDILKIFLGAFIVLGVTGAVIRLLLR